MNTKIKISHKRVKNKILNTFSRFSLSALVVTSFFYTAPIFINFVDKNFNNKEFTNNSKNILNKTLNRGKTFEEDDTWMQSNEIDLLYDILEENNSFYLCYGKEKLINCNKLKLNGNHNYENILAALAASRLIGIDLSDALDAICSFQGLPHRMQSISNHNSIEYINDSKGTNVDAAIASISSLKKKIILLAGGQSKGGNFEQFAEAIKNKVKRAYLFGEDAKIIGNELNKFVPVVFVDNLEDAVISAKKSSSPGDVILLSPACASFDQFDSFIHRGKEFERIVGEITK